MRTFWITTLGCKVNQYESEQIITLLRSRGLAPVDNPREADLRVINTCSVTIQAASKSRQTARQVVRLPVLGGSVMDGGHGREGRTIVMGCWASSDPARASSLGGVSAVIGHHDDVAGELDRLITLWQAEDSEPPAKPMNPQTSECKPESAGNEGWMIPASTLTRLAAHNKPQYTDEVKEKDARKAGRSDGNPGKEHRQVTAGEHVGEAVAGMLPFATLGETKHEQRTGTAGLPMLGEHQSGHQRAFLKIQDGCDAHCTYCIIPRLRPALWSKSIEDVVSEAQRLVDAGHLEIVLTGIFLGAYGQETALRRRQAVAEQGKRSLLAQLIDAICAQVAGLRRLRLSSLEPGDLTQELIDVLRSHPQAVPHFHLPLQSGSDALLRRMNRQYRREDYLRMIERVREAFDRPAITTDIIVGFPGESDEEFERTVEVAEAAGFIHIHAFPFSPRPGTAAARWREQFVRGPVVNERIERLQTIAEKQSLDFRRGFAGEVVEIMVERLPASALSSPRPEPLIQHGRCPRYFSVHFEHPEPLTGRCVAVKIDRVTPGRTHGALAYNPRR